MSLVTNGANGETQNELLKLLDNKVMEEINEINLKILSELKEISSLEIGNAIMTKLSPLNTFRKIAKDNYLAEIQPLKNVKQVNKWCEKKTHGKIKEIIDRLDDNIFMIILNAVYFKGQWINPFSKGLTTKKMFYNYNSEKDGKKVETMSNTKHYSYFEDSNLQAIDLKYKKDAMSALIILPNKKIDINEFISLLLMNICILLLII
jgi:serpin B